MSENIVSAHGAPVAFELCGSLRVFWPALADARVGQGWSDSRRDGHDEWRDEATVVYRDDDLVVVTIVTESIIGCIDRQTARVLVFHLRGSAQVEAVG